MELEGRYERDLDIHPKGEALIRLWHGCTVVAEAQTDIDWVNNWIIGKFTLTTGSIVDSYDVSLLGVDAEKSSTMLDTPFVATPGMSLCMVIHLEDL